MSCLRMAVLGLLVASAAAQEAAPAAQVARAETLLRAHGKRSLAIKVLVADYVQRRTTKLLAEPLVSKGEFLFVREPAVVMFRATEPRLSVVRLSARLYEVYRPTKKQLERFHLEGPELAQGLFAAVGGDAERLLRDFVITACRDLAATAEVGERVVVQMAPRQADVRARLSELSITLHAKDGALAAVAYRDQAGDLIEIELLRLRLDPTDAPSATLEVPKDTVVVEHASAPTKSK